MVSRTVVDKPTPFDLNIEKVLDHWTVAFALRELIANALDEQTLSASAEVTVTMTAERTCVIRDFGRGLEYTHLTQNENAEKRKHPAVIGQFGMGLKDALAVFDRRKVSVGIRSRHGDITTARLPKDGFGDVVTLHAVVAPPSDPNLVGTEITVVGVSANDVDAAKAFFLRYSDEQILETTGVGQVLQRSPGAKTDAKIYVKGLLVATEPNFLFSYNVTDLSAALRRALNRERSNVGRTAYTDRVKAILKACTSTAVAEQLSNDLAIFASGRQHDELAWRDVALHACRVLASNEKVLFISAYQLEAGSAQIDYAKADGYRLVVVPDDIAAKIGKTMDLNGEPLVDLGIYRERWNDSFEFHFVPPDDLNPDERRLYDLSRRAFAAAGSRSDRSLVAEIAISETMRLDASGFAVVGLWEPALKRIVVRRDQLAAAHTYFGTLLHELTHAATGTPDGSLAFEEALSGVLGRVAASLLIPTVGAGEAVGAPAG